MKNNKQLGIWMDHSVAFLMEMTNGTIVNNIVTSDFSHEDKENGLSKNEKLMLNKEKQHQSHYYKSLSDTIKNYQEVILFGPTEAKNELLNLLKADHFFESIKIEVKDSDKMTENQMHAFVRKYFK